MPNIMRTVTTPIKCALQVLFDRLATRSELFKQPTQLLEKRIAKLQDTIFHLTPDVIEPSEAAKQAVAAVLVKNAIIPDQMNLKICKSDLMYQYIVREFDTVDQAQKSYIRSGLHMMQVLQTILCHKFGDLKRVEAFLDFASGYGRLTRFMVQRIQPCRIWISDIKPRAVQFQQQQFGVQGFVSTVQPEELSLSQRFDCIFVGSLFSHLPEETFGRWLQRLSDMLTSDGVLILTVHDSSLLNSPGGKIIGQITFFHSSEEAVVRGADEPLDPENYGTTYVTEDFVRSVIQSLKVENKTYVRYKKGMWGIQDIYLLSPNNAADLSGLVLPTP